MTVAFRSGSSDLANTDDELVMTKPAGLVSRDVMVAVVSKSGGVSEVLAAPAGWTLVRSDASSVTMAVSVWTKVATASEPASYTWTWSPSTNRDALGFIVAYSGVDNLAAVDISGSGNGTGNTITAPSVTTTEANTLILSILSSVGGTLADVPAGTTDRASGTASSLHARIVEAAQATAAASTARADNVGVNSGWVGTSIALAPFINAAPYAPTLVAPVGSASVATTGTQRFSWTFSDPDAEDTQSAYELRYRLGSGAWTTVSGTTPTQYRDITGASFTAGAWEWQVRTSDNFGPTFGAWSSTGHYTVVAPPAGVTITAPANNSTVSTNVVEVTWSSSVQDAYQLRVVGDLAGAPDTGTVIFDTGVVESPGTRSLSVSMPTNGVTRHIQVQERDSGLWQASWSSVKVNVSYVAPPLPTISLTPDDAAASITLAVTNPAPNLLSANEASFETGIGEWGVNAAGSLDNPTIAAQDGVDGTKALRITAVTTAAIAAHIGATTSAGPRALSVVVGQRVTFAASVRVLTAPTGVVAGTIRLQWFDAAGVSLSVDDTDGWNWTNVMTRRSVTALAPANAAHVRGLLRLASGHAVSDTVAADSVTLRKSTTDTVFSPGDQPAVDGNDVWRRVAADGGDGIRVAVDVARNGDWTDYTPASGVEYEYRVTAHGDNTTSSDGAWTA